MAILHSFYRSGRPSGENDTCIRQFSFLAEAGVDVTLISVSTDDLRRSAGYSVRTALNVAHHTGLSPAAQLAAVKPDVVHVFNLFPNVGTSWIDKTSAAVVATLHNYRALCSAGTLSRDGESCSLCARGNTFPALRYACYRDSRLATLPLAVRNAGGVRRDPVLNSADLLIAPSDTVKRAYETFMHKMAVVTEPTDAPPQATASKRQGFLYLGRLDPEKGIMQMLDAWPVEVPLGIAGDGSLMAEARATAHRRRLEVSFHGYVTDPVQKSRLLSEAEALVFPSTWREGAPLVYAEAMAAGLPVIAMAGNAVAESVAEDGTGVVVQALSTSEFARAISVIRAGEDGLHVACGTTYQEKYSLERWLNVMRATYGDAVQRRRARCTPGATR